VDGELAAAVIDALGTQVVVVDRSGDIVWVSAAWREASGRCAADPLATAEIGSNLIRLLAATKQPSAEATAAGIAAVAGGGRPRSVGKLSTADASTQWLIIARELPVPDRGAVVTRSDTDSGYPAPPPGAADANELRDAIASLSPRELEVLRLMTRGLDNRAIAANLGIAYTTVRTHARSLIEKLGARSRLDAVARAYRSGVGSTR